MATPPSPSIHNLTSRNPWEPQTSHSTPHSNGHPLETHHHANGNYTPTSSPPSTPHSSSSTFTSENNNENSPAAISLRAFLLGSTFSASLLTTLYLAYPPTTTPLWRLPLFLTLLSLFHFLEYYTTALSNPPFATVSAFLLSSNGRAYNIAHGTAFLEAILHHYYFPSYSYTFNLFPTIPATYHNILLALGAAMICIGQGTRTTAMVHAGSNFNHLIQSRKKEGHVLVTGGVYRYLRHPSYFGFFWWGLGTQVVLGNVVCLGAYAVVLWRFFRRRIEKEETLLVGFFGMDYVRYRDRTRVGIPFIA